MALTTKCHPCIQVPIFQVHLVAILTNTKESEVCAQCALHIPNLKANVANVAPSWGEVAECNPIIMPLNTRWSAVFSSPSWCWCKQGATQGTRKSKVVRTCCVLLPLAPLHQNPTNPNKALCTLPPPRLHVKPRSRKQQDKKHNLTSDENI